MLGVYDGRGKRAAQFSVGVGSRMLHRSSWGCASPIMLRMEATK